MSSVVVDEENGGIAVQTKKIVDGTPSVEGRGPAVQPQEGNPELAAKFSALLSQMLGDTGVQAMLGGAANLGIQAQIAPLPEKPAEIREVKEAPVEQEELAVTEEEKDSYVRTEEDSEQPEEQAVVVEEEQAVVAQVVAVEHKPVEVTEEVTERTVEEMPKMLEQVVAQAQEQQVTPQQTAEATEAGAFMLKKTEAAAAPTANEAVRETDVEAQAVRPLQDQAGASVVKTEAVKTAVKDVSRQRSEDYFAIQRALEASEAQDAPSEILTEAPKPQAAPVSAPTLGQMMRNQAAEGAAAQGALARGAALGEQTQSSAGVKSQGQGVVFDIGVNARAAAEKLAAMKGKSAKEVPSKDRQAVVEQMKDLLAKAIQTRDGNSISVRLNPPELGQMTVKVTQRESKVYARIIPESPEVEALLRQRAGDVTQVLIAAGLKPSQVHVSIGAERTDAETHQFQDLMGRGSAENGQDRSRGRDEAGDAERGMPFMNTAVDAEEILADSGWVA